MTFTGGVRGMVGFVGKERIHKWVEWICEEREGAMGGEWGERKGTLGEEGGAVDGEGGMRGELYGCIGISVLCWFGTSVKVIPSSPPPPPLYV